jgi:carboxypeptidase PM20D1
MPPPHTTVGLLAEAITRLENNPMPARIAGPTQALFDTVGPEFPIAQRLVFANLWLLKNVVLAKLGAKPGTNALIRTTFAATMFQGSVKENVLPTKARALVNSRILPGDTMESVEAHARSVINMPEVSIKSLAKWGQNPSPASCIDCDSYHLISKTIHEIYPDTLVAPSTVVGATDARYYQQVSDRVYRFAPQLVLPEDRKRFHGINERVHSTHYANAVRFYRQLVLNVNN